MKTSEEEAIERASNQYSLCLLSQQEAFIAGALSQEAKAYWQRNMYSEQDVISIVCEFKDIPTLLYEK